MHIADVAFCDSESSANARLFAVAISARVDIYKLSQPEENPEFEEDSLKPRQQLFKFDDTTTAINFRQDGQLLLAGEKTGRIQLFELNNKFVLRQYTSFSNRINCMTFDQSNQKFLACANETSIKYFDI